MYLHIIINFAKQRRSFGCFLSDETPSEIYELLIFRNWRRSGKFYYRPDNEHMCCPQYAIRLKTDIFKPSKEQNRVMNKLVRLLKGGDCPKNKDTASVSMTDLMDESLLFIKSEIFSVLEANYPELCVNLGLNVNDIKIRLPNKKSEGKFSCDALISIFGKLNSKKFSKVNGINPNETPQNMASLITNCMKKNEKLDKYKLSLLEPSNIGHINFTWKDYVPASNQINLKTPFSRDFKSTDRKLVLKLSPASFKNDEYMVFRKYQTEIHREQEEDISVTSYSRFLCDSSLKSELTGHGKSKLILYCDPFEYRTTSTLKFTEVKFEESSARGFLGFGTYHLRYEVAEVGSGLCELIGVSVLDILPTGISSVYFFYDTKFKKLSPGTLSALVEIELIQYFSAQLRADSYLNSAAQDFQYYYLGFYIHNCTKMRYKANFEPSEILCPITLKWVILDGRVRNILDHKKYARLAMSDEYNYSLCEQAEKVENGRFELKSDAIEEVTLDSRLEKLNFCLNRDGRGQASIIPGPILFQAFSLNEKYLQEVLIEWIKLTGIKLSSRIVIDLY